MKISSRIGINTVSSWLSKLVAAAVGMVVVPVLIEGLGLEGYGLASLVGVIVSLALALDLGIRMALSRHLAEQLAKENAQRFNELFCTALTIYVALGFLIAAGCWVGAPLLADVFKVSPELHAQAIELIRWYGGATVLLSFITPVFSAVISANNRYDVLNVATTALGIAQGLVLIAVLSLTESALFGWACVMLASQTINAVIIAVAAHRIQPTLQLRVRHLRKDSLGDLFKLGGSVFAIRLTNMLSVRSDPIVLTTFFGPAGVALYRPAVRLCSLARPVVNSLAEQLHPVATGMHVKDKAEQLQKVLILGTRYTLLMGLPACVFLGCFAEPIIRVWLADKLGDQYHVTVWVLIGWIVVDLFGYCSGSQWPVLLGMNKVKFVLWTNLPLGVANLLISIYLVGYTSLGVAGVVVATAIIGAIRRPVLTVYSARQVGLKAGEYLRQAYMRPMLMGLCYLALCLSLRMSTDIETFLPLAMMAGVAALLWIPLCWWVGFDSTDRGRMGGLVAKAVARVTR